MLKKKLMIQVMNLIGSNKMISFNSKIKKINNNIKWIELKKKVIMTTCT
jgi:hypothetical protein